MSRHTTPYWTPRCALLAAITSWAAGSSDLVHQRGGLRASMSADAFAKEISEAMSRALGCGQQVGSVEIARIEEKLRPVWNSLPKNSLGRIEKRMLRYITYRYFMRESSMLLRGFEPSQPAASSDFASADVLSSGLPGFVESVLQSKHSEQQGFGLRDAAYVVATLEQLVFDSEEALLQRAYGSSDVPTSERLDQGGLHSVLEDYMLEWMIGDNPDGLRLLSQDRRLVTRAIPHWHDLRQFISGEISSFRHRRMRAAPGTLSSNPLSQDFTFDDAHQIVGGITKRFASYWSSECYHMEESLLRAGGRRDTGRLPLSRFYSTNLGGGEWRFSESEQYLRELGALDETSAWRGKQVIVSNYVQSASNCVVVHSHYLICCRNRCADILEDIEAAVGAPVADAAVIWELLTNASASQGADDDGGGAPRLPDSLRGQLDGIAAANAGLVPLHGRLFAQWLHFAYPLDCAFPHKAGAARMVTPGSFGTAYTATDSEIRTHAYTLPNETGGEDQQWMSQWSEEEELLADYGNHVGATWQRAFGAGLLGLVAVGLAAAGLAGASARGPGGPALPTHGKAHCI